MITSELELRDGNNPRSLPSRAIKRGARSEAGTEKVYSSAGYQLLPAQFPRDGFVYQQIAREGDAAIYEQKWSGCVNPSVSYEVIRARRRPGFQIDRRFVKPAEVYPNSEAWGVDGFTLIDKDAAFAKLREVAAQ